MASSAPTAYPPQKGLAKRLSDESALAHRTLRAHFECIERALEEGDLHRGADLMGELIDHARDHFFHSETLARRAGLPPSKVGCVHHDVMLERARMLKARCLRPPEDIDLCHGIMIQVVSFLSDLVEDDLRTVRQVRGTEIAAD